MAAQGTGSCARSELPIREYVNRPGFPGMWKKLVAEILREPAFNDMRRDKPTTERRDRAERLLEQTILFLLVYGRNPHTAVWPSREVYIGWLVCLRYTRWYKDFCTDFARFLHHDPLEPGEWPTSTVIATIALIEANEDLWLNLDPPLWAE